VAKLAPSVRRRLVFFAYVLGAALIVLLLPARLTAPVRILFVEVAGPGEGAAFAGAGNTLSATGTLRDAFLSEERERLDRQQVRRLLNDYEHIRERLHDQERRLRSFEQLDVAEFRFRAVSASVTAYDTSPMRQSVTIAAGTRDGVRQGMAAVADGALVGTVSEAGPWRSRIRLITDAASLLSCRVSRTRGLCVLRGTGTVHCTVEWLDRDAPARLGDVLVTAPIRSGASGAPLIPGGLPVAWIMALEEGRSDPLFLWVKAAPRVNVRRLEVVEVIVPVGNAAGAAADDTAP